MRASTAKTSSTSSPMRNGGRKSGAGSRGRPSRAGLSWTIHGWRKWSAARFSSATRHPSSSTRSRPVTHTSTKRQPPLWRGIGRRYPRIAESVRPLSVRRRGDQGRGHRQRRPAVLDRPADVLVRPPAVPAGQGGGRVGSGALCRSQRPRPPRAARGRRPAPDAARLRHIPRLGHRPARTAPTMCASCATPRSNR